jgi:hypothetical protein
MSGILSKNFYNRLLLYACDFSSGCVCSLAIYFYKLRQQDPETRPGQKVKRGFDLNPGS